MVLESMGTAAMRFGLGWTLTFSLPPIILGGIEELYVGLEHIMLPSYECKKVFNIFLKILVNHLERILVNT